MSLTLLFISLACTKSKPIGHTGSFVEEGTVYLDSGGYLSGKDCDDNSTIYPNSTELCDSINKQCVFSLVVQ